MTRTQSPGRTSSTVTPTPTPDPNCPPAPLNGCRQTLFENKALLVLKKKDGDNDKLVWKWVKGEATTGADFGDPTTSTTYAICVYDESGGTPGLKLESVVPPGSQWTATSSGFKYNDPTLGADGVRSVHLKSGAPDRAKANLKGKGSGLAMPALGLDGPVTARLVRIGTGACWEATFSAPTRNDATTFKAKSD